LILFDDTKDLQFSSGTAPPPVAHGPRVQVDAAAAPVVHESRAQPSVAISNPPFC